MKIITTIIAALLCLLLFPANFQTSAEKKEWFGDWAMNLDGSMGTLRITERRSDCVSPAWCDMEISYIEGNGGHRRGRIARIDNNWQYMVFDIFIGSWQRFDAYLMSQDEDKMAGTAYLQGRTVGFYATKKSDNQAISFNSSEPLRRNSERIGNQSRSPLSIEQLRQIAQRINSVEALSKRINKPIFSINSRARTFSYDHGDLPVFSHPYGPPNPILIPLFRLIQLDDLRAYLKRANGADPDFWRPYFDIAEATIEKNMLDGIASGKATIDDLNRYDSVITEVFQNLAPDVFGRLKSLQRQRPPRVIAAKHLVKTTFEVVPRALLFIIDDVSYAISEITNEEPKWRQVFYDNNAEIDLGGLYLYKVEWPGETRKEKLLVDRARRFTIRQ